MTAHAPGPGFRCTALPLTAPWSVPGGIRGMHWSRPTKEAKGRHHCLEGQNVGGVGLLVGHGTSRTTLDASLLPV